MLLLSADPARPTAMDDVASKGGSRVANGDGGGMSNYWLQHSQDDSIVFKTLAATTASNATRLPNQTIDTLTLLLLPSGNQVHSSK